jgi:hypothetical protein
MTDATWVKRVRRRGAIADALAYGSFSDWHALPLSTLEAVVALLDTPKEG